MNHHKLSSKNIPDRPILEFLAGHQGHWCHWFGSAGEWMDRSVRNAMLPGLPDKLILAKMKGMIRRGLVEGCGCGCRGDYEITRKGLAVLGMEPSEPLWYEEDERLRASLRAKGIL